MKGSEIDRLTNQGIVRGYALWCLWLGHLITVFACTALACGFVGLAIVGAVQVLS